jgi:ABC-type lipoprotein export system ATPase subunit
MGFSRWLLADLQVHTPADKNHRYGDVGGPEPNETFARTLLQAHLDAGVQIVAVTDHNSVAWWPVLDKVGKELGIFVFPGIEVNVNKCHLMAIWDRDESGYKLAQQFLTRSFEPGVEPLDPDRTPRPLAQGSVLEVAQRAVEGKALVFAPHSTAKRIGLFGKNVCNTSSDVARSGVVSGFDVMNDKGLDVLKNPAAEFGPLIPPWFSSGDVRDLAEVGKRACFLKTGEEPTLESLRQAFLMPATRVRLRGEMQQRWNHVKHVTFLDTPEPACARIESISVEGGFHHGLEVEFGPGLNAVIGGKGTGKSTLLEILRFALEAPPSIAPKAVSKDGRDSLSANFPSNAEAVVAFVDAGGEGYEVRRVGGSPSGGLYSEGNKLDIDPRRRIGVVVFGQRELAALPSRSDALEDFALSRHEKEHAEASSKVEKVLEKARKIAEELDDLDYELADFGETKEELEDINEKLDKIVKAGSSDLASESEALQQADDALRELFAWPHEVIEQAEALAELVPPELPDHPKLPSGIKSTRRDGQREIAKAGKAAIDAAKKLEGKLDEHEVAWETSREERREEIARLLADAGLDDPAELGQLQARKVELARQLRDSAGKQKARAKLLPKREAAIEELEAARRARSRLLEDAVAELNDMTGERVRIKLEPLSDRSLLVEFLGEEINERKLTPTQVSRLDQLTGRDLAEAAFSKEDDAFDKLGLTSGLVENLEEAEGPTVRLLEEIESPDQITIEVNLAESGAARWTDVEDASPGQAATAMLELALISSDEPLIIDQPEDDLDNRFIYDEVVTKIAEVAAHRQVIVATHNANIPVLGDAELMLALDASTNKGKVLACGGLDEPVVADTARRILEGGAQAFDERARRYSKGA